MKWQVGKLWAGGEVRQAGKWGKRESGRRASEAGGKVRGSRGSGGRRESGAGEEVGQ